MALSELFNVQSFIFHFVEFITIHFKHFLSSVWFFLHFIGSFIQILALLHFTHLPLSSAPLFDLVHEVLLSEYPSLLVSWRQNICVYILAPPQGIYLTSLCLDFFICQVGVILVPNSQSYCGN